MIIELLPVLIDPDRYRIIIHLLREPATQKQLADALELNSGTLSRHMKTLERAGLTYRERSHSPYRLLFRDRLESLLKDVANLELEVAEARVEALNEQAEMLRRAGVRPAASSKQSESVR